MRIANLAQKKFISLFFFSLLLILSLQKPSPVNANTDCTLTFARAMTTSNGLGTMVIFNSPVSTTANNVGVTTVGGRRYWITSVPGKPYAVTQVPKQTTTFNVAFENKDGTCNRGGVSADNLPYNSSLDPSNTNTGGAGGSSVDVPCNTTCSIGGILSFDTGDSGGQTVSTILTVSISIAAVVAFILAGFGAVKITTSAGNPNGINAGREMIISAISGLLFIVFAVTILEIIGVRILGLPGIQVTPNI